MSYSSDYFALKQKRKKKSEEYKPSRYNETKKVTKKEEQSALSWRNDEIGGNNDDIAPVKKQESGYFQKSSYFDDGYQFGDVVKTIGATLGDAIENIGKGGANFLESTWDGMLTLGTKMNEGSMMQAAQSEMMYNAISGNKESASKTLERYTKAQDEAERETAKYVAKNIIQEDKIDFGLDEESVLGEKSDSLVQSATDVGLRKAMSYIPVVGVPLSFASTGLSVMGNEAENAFKSGATYDEAVLSGMISAAAEMGTEQLTGGIKLGGKTLTGAATSKIASTISNKTLGTLAKWGLNTAGEGFEEVASGLLSAVGQKITYADEKEFNELFSSEDAWDNFVGGAVLGGFFDGVNIAKSNIKGIDYISGLKKTDKAVVDKVYKDAVAEQEKIKGKKLTTKEKTKIFDNVIEQAEKGGIEIDTIEEVLGGETYEQYKKTADKRQELVDQKEKLQKELAELENSPNTIGNAKRYEAIEADIKSVDAKIQEFDKYPVLQNLKTQLSDEVYAIAKDGKLVESYNEKARKGQAFEADLTQYTGKQREAVERAVKSGVLNNTNKSHALVDTLSKIEAEKGVIFDYTDNAKLKESGFAVEGKTVNGFEKNGTVTLNMQSAKAWQSVVGHEITHILEGTESYTELRNALYKYAESKGELESRRTALTALYKNLDADIDAELTADLVGDYLFSDSDFVKGLTTNKNLFQRIYDEIKYLCKVATGKELTEIEKVKREFDKAWEELSLNESLENEATDTENDNVNYSLVEDQKTIDFLENQDYIVTYKAMVQIDGKLYPPMASQNYVEETYTTKKGETKTRKVRKLKNPSVLGKWQQSDERPDLVTKMQPPSKKYPDGYGKFDLLKSNGKTTPDVAYNPYEHTSNIVLNDQFSEAYQRPELVTVEYHIPVSELTSGYKAKYAKDPVGLTDWKAGGVAQKLKNSHRDVYLTRWSKPVRVLDDAEVAAKYKEILDKEEGISVPWNVVTPSLREELEKIGVPIDYSDIKAGSTIRTFEAAMRGDYDKKGKKAKYSVSEDSNGNELSLAVQKRFANSKAVDENGNLKVLYHGTYNGEFYTFDKSKGSVEGDFGSGFYFTDSESDVAKNYEGGGPDFENKIDRRAEQIEAEEGIDYIKARKKAIKELFVGSNKHTVYLNIENPAIVGETNLLDYDSFAEEYDRNDYDSDEDYESDVEYLIADKIDSIIWDIDRNVDIYSTDGIAEVLWNAVNEGGIDIEQLKANINNLYLEDNNGNFVGNEVTRQIIESLGYDGIIDNTVSTKFNMNIESGTTHYIVFKPNQIKSIDNQNPTDNPDIRYSLSKNILDNGNDLVYNGKRGEGYAQTDEFRNLYAECKRMSDEDIQLYHSGNKQIDEELRANLARILRTQIDTYRNGLRNDDGLLNLSNKGNEFNMCKSVDGSLFHDVFEVAQKYLRNGELVDLHEVETTKDGIGYNDCYNYLSDDGLSGFSITPDGDLISVFNSSGKSGFLGAIAPVVKNNAKTLDCYNSPNQPLRGMYEKMFGFKTASLMDYNMEYDHDNIAENHGMPQIAFMVNAESEVETRQFTKDEYDEAVAYRNSFVNQAAQNEAASFMPEDIAPVKDSLSYEGEQASNVGTPLKDLHLAPTNETISKVETVDDAPMLENIPVLPDEELEQGTIAAIKPKPVKQPSLKKVDNADNKEKIAQVLTEEPKVEKKKKSIISKAISNFVDKGAVFENLSLKTKNRTLQDTYKAIGRSETKATYFMENGTDGVKSLDSIRAEVEQTGKTKEFYEYLYHKHNVDRMSLESKELPNLQRLEGEMKKLKLLKLQENQLRAIASEKITKETAPKRVNLIKTVREYLASKDVKNKPVFDYSVTSEMSEEIANKYEAENPKFKEYAQDVYNYMNYLRKMMVYNGVISQETAELWAEMYPNYVPIRRADHDGLSINVPLDTNKTGINAPIKRATGGNSDILPLFSTMAQRTMQTFKAIDKNRFGVELKDTLGGVVESTKTNLDEIIDSIDSHEDLLQEGKNGKNPTFTVFEGGDRITFDITDEMYDALKPTSEGLSYTNKVLNTASNLHRGVLTEYSVPFMVSNAIKDAQDVLINSQHPAQTYANFPVAIKELSTKGKWYTEYMENGGGDNTYFDKQTNTFTKEKSQLRKIIGFPFDKISEANNFIEKAPRLAEYIASRKKGASIDAAMLDAARVTTDFSAGGDVTKFLNRNGATFLNASVQGFAQQVRNVREAKANGLKGWLGLATKYAIAGLPALLLNGALWDDDEDYEELSDYVKENYYVVAKYGDGKFVRIPKGRALAVIQNGFEQISNALTGNDEVDFGRFFELFISNLAPNNPLDNNIIAPIKQVIDNKTWYGDDLVPTRLQDLPAAEQYDESTDAISKWLGENLNVSPYKINYLLNQYSGGFGDIFLPMMTPEAESGDNSFVGNIIAPLKDKFTTDSVMNNQYVSSFYDTVDKVTTNAKSSYATDEDILKSKYMNSVNTELGDLYKAKREIQNSNLSDSVKYKQVKNLQEQINDLAKNALNSYESVNVQDGYATVGDKHYRLDDGVWTKISDKQLERQQEVTSELGISPSEYWSKTEISFFPNSDGEYEYAYDNPEKYAVAKAVGGYSTYKSYSKALYNIKADKDSNGKSINGSRKEKVIDYINNLDADYETKIILFKSEYPSDDTYNADIVNYINGRNDLTYEEKISIYTELGFTVKDGNVYWD